MKYKKQSKQNAAIIGMLYIVEVRMVVTATKETIKQKLLVVGGEADDIERKLKWIYDPSKYSSFSVSDIEKVREKVHVLSTTIKQDDGSAGPVMKADEGSTAIAQGKLYTEKYDPKLFAIGISTTMMAKDEMHALRKVGHAIVSSASDVKSHSGASLSADSTVTVEEISMSSGRAKPRDVSSEINRAHFVRG